MCIILGQVNSVSQTKIFTLTNKNKTRQMTFYSNAVNTPEENMMILPVPTKNGSIELVKHDYKDLFQDLRKSVKEIVSHDPNWGLMRSAALASDTRKPLEVILHGSYYCSIAPTFEDLARLDSGYFDMTPELLEFFAKNYNREFSYLCCVLKPGLEAYEPLCYSHPMHSSGKLFVPTLHYHVHDSTIHTDTADWDHLLYSVGTVERANRGFVSNYNNEIHWKKFPEEFQKLQVASVRCAKISGNFKNQDIGFELY